MTEKLPTIKLKGKDYVQVKDRILFFNEEYENGAIKTSVEVKQDGSYAWFTATVLPDVKNLERCFIARSAGPVDEEKSYEKLETVAVGRALAFMGIGVIESIASADEIQNFENKKKYAGTQYENRKTTNVKQKIEFEKGDQLKTGIKKSGKGKWYAIDKANGKREWLTLQQYEYLANVSQGEKFSPLTEEVDSIPLPEEYPNYDTHYEDLKNDRA